MPDTNDGDKGLSQLVKAILVAVIPGIIAFGLTFLDSQRNEALAHVNDQISKLYGPLYVTSQADCDTWSGVARSEWSRLKYAFSKSTTIEQTRQWRLWMTTVFQPMNVQMEQAILSNSQLVIGDRMPASFGALIAHTEGYKIVISRWQTSTAKSPDFTSRAANVSSLNYPTAINECARRGYLALKERQVILESGRYIEFLSPLVPDHSCNEVNSRPDRDSSTLKAVSRTPDSSDFMPCDSDRKRS
jgi:hypothetical protein